jgi:hypothetical protein
VDLLAGGVLLENRPDGTWPAQVLSEQPSAGVAIGDLDGDDRPEIILGPHGGAGPLLALQRSGGAWLARPSGSPLTGPVHHVELADLDHDGDGDLVVASAAQGLIALLNQGGGLRWSETTLDPHGPHDFAAADVDGDLDVDLVGSDPAGTTGLVLWRNAAVAGPPTSSPAPVTVTADPTPMPAPPTVPTIVPPDPAVAEPAAAAAPDHAASGEPTGSEAVALGSAQVSTAPAAPLVTEPSAAPADPSTPALALGPPAVDPAVQVLPATLERSIERVERGGRTAGPVAALATTLAGVLLGAGCLLTRRRHGLAVPVAGATATDQVLSDGAGAAGGRAGGTDRAAPTGDHPAS